VKKSTIVLFAVLFSGAILMSAAYPQTGEQASSSSINAQSDTAAAQMQRKANRKLSALVRRTLEKAGIDVSSVVIKANSGAVTLIGDVPDGGQIARAQAIAGGVGGVTSVDNKLTIRPEP
jgi:hyperosmotically inducible periplasmic protein